MRTSCSVFVIGAILQVISGEEPAVGPPPPGPLGPNSGNDLRPPYSFQGVPRLCWGPPKGIDPYLCCPVPKLYSDENFDACGIEKPTPGAPPGPNNRPDIECKKGKCLMKAAKLLKDDESVDYEKVRAYVDNWGKSNPDFAENIEKAKKVCVVEKGPQGRPPHICEPDRIFFCLNSNIIWNCKLKEEPEQCKHLQAHMDECRPFFERPGIQKR